MAGWWIIPAVVLGAAGWWVLLIGGVGKAIAVQAGCDGMGLGLCGVMPSPTIHRSIAPPFIFVVAVRFFAFNRHLA